MFGDIFFCRVDKAGSENDACHWLEVNSSFFLRFIVLRALSTGNLYILISSVYLRRVSNSTCWLLSSRPRAVMFAGFQKRPYFVLTQWRG